MPGTDRRRGSGPVRSNTRTRQQDKVEEAVSQLPPTHGCGAITVPRHLVACPEIFK